MVFWLDFSIKIGDFGVEFHKISLSSIIEVSWNITYAMLVKNGFIKRATLLAYSDIQ